MKKEKNGNKITKEKETTKKTTPTLKEKIKAKFANNKIKKREKEIKKLNALYPEEFNSTEFHIPNIIHTVDDAVRRDNELCKGAIGWRENIADTEILFLYDEFAPQTNITFLPKFDCDATYYVDSHDRSKYIKVDYLFTKSHEEKLAELKHIAYSLGAKKCSIEIIENSYKTKSKNTNFTQKEKANIEASSNFENKETHIGTSEIVFSGNNTPVQPTLKWFAYDDNIKKLIDMRLNNVNSIKSEVLKLSGSASSTISLKAAINIDNFLKKFEKISSNFTTQAKSESDSSLIFKIEF